MPCDWRVCIRSGWRRSWINAGIYVWDGNYYALAVTTRLGVEDDGGMVRIGPVHYNTLEEVDRFGEAMQEIARSR